MKVKNEKLKVKSAIVAIIALFAIIGCSMPETDMPFVDWNNVNVEYDNARNTIASIKCPNCGELNLSYEIICSNCATFLLGSPYAPAVTGVINANVGGQDYTKVNSVTITFPKEADILRKGSLSDMEIELKKFLEFYTFSPTETVTDSKVHSLSALSNAYSIEKQVIDNATGKGILTLKFASPFSETSSNIVWKIKGDEYTFLNGKKMDYDGDGVTGEADYDSMYGSIVVVGSTHSAVIPKVPNPLVSLYLIIQVEDMDIASGNTDSYSVTDFEVATAPNSNWLALVITDPDEEKAVYDSIMSKFASNFKIQEFNGGTWSNMSASISYDSALQKLKTSFTAASGRAYRVIFEKGSGDLITDEIFGLKQKVTITNSKGESYDNHTSWTMIAGEPAAYYNEDKVKFEDFRNNTSYSTIYQDASGANKEIQFTLTSGIPGTGTDTYYMKEISESEFKSNFKIYSYDGIFVPGSAGGMVTDWAEANNYLVTNYGIIVPGITTGGTSATFNDNLDLIYNAAVNRYDQMTIICSQVSSIYLNVEDLFNNYTTYDIEEEYGFDSGDFSSYSLVQIQAEVINKVLSDNYGYIVNAYPADMGDGTIKAAVNIIDRLYSTNATSYSPSNALDIIAGVLYDLKLINNYTVQYYSATTAGNAARSHVSNSAITAAGLIPVPPSVAILPGDMREVPITGVEFKRSSNLTSDDVGCDILIIKLGPGFRSGGNQLILIDSGFGYADGITIFSSSVPFRNEGKAAYGPYQF